MGDKINIRPGPVRWTRPSLAKGAAVCDVIARTRSPSGVLGRKEEPKKGDEIGRAPGDREQEENEGEEECWLGKLEGGNDTCREVESAFLM